ncbi:general secretion pathway protein [Flavobacterium sp. 1355]|uniref:general secretion pathway protein n=1 Tax=Flavobacterium sp. 1355 TaxID=2806571 RepID=UPI001AEAD724|nr:general secretion pathway protein [Flavobacterium sp. 1355]MBP1221758.1 membrane-bound ClpP family serine protease [Flavobacterium sp. 1355]
MWFLKLILIITLLVVLYQDCKDRLVYWFLYPIIGVLVFSIQSYYLPFELAFFNSGLNLLFVAILLGVSFMYIKFRKLSFQNAIGLGDVLFFIFLSFGFATISFIVLFVFSLIFSLLLHFIFQNKNQLKTVPLAGYMSLFFGVVYTVTFWSHSTILYAY